MDVEDMNIEDMNIEPVEFEFAIGDIVEEHSSTGYRARYIVIEKVEFPKSENLIYTLYTIWTNNNPWMLPEKPGTIDYLMSYEINEGKSIKWKIL